MPRESGPNVGKFWDKLCEAIGEDADDVMDITLHRDAAFTTTVSLTKYPKVEQAAQLDALEVTAADLDVLEVEVTRG